MVVDDDPAVLGWMTRLLTSVGFEVTSAEGGRAAIEELCRAVADGTEYDAILLDIAMPDINGWRVLDAIKANPLWSDMKVIVLSGYSQSPEALSRVARYDGVFVEKKGDFDRLVVGLLERLLAEPEAVAI
jgi:two-component system chemotaxis response regulator CheY